MSDFAASLAELDPYFVADLERNLLNAAPVSRGTERDAIAYVTIVHFQTPGAYRFVAGQLALAGLDLRPWLIDLIWRASLVANWRWRLQDGRALTYGRKFAPPPARPWGCAAGAPCLGCVACQHRLT